MEATKPTCIYLDGLSDLCRSTENQISRLVGHSGEKGRLLEETLRTVLRKFLPRKYELGSGFIVDATGNLSSQTDIIVYDNQLNSPIVTESSSILFPIECVYAAIEVKGKRELAISSDIRFYLQYDCRINRHGCDASSLRTQQTAGTLARPVCARKKMARMAEAARVQGCTECKSRRRAS
jgi:Domain of unknown function (DUF6602)